MCRSADTLITLTGGYSKRIIVVNYTIFCLGGCVDETKKGFRKAFGQSISTRHSPSWGVPLLFPYLIFVLLSLLYSFIFLYDFAFVEIYVDYMLVSGRRAIENIFAGVASSVL